MKLKRYPKKPKASASVESMQKYLQRVREIDAQNRQRVADDKKKKSLHKQISGLGTVTKISARTVSATPHRKKRSGGKRKK